MKIGLLKAFENSDRQIIDGTIDVDDFEKYFDPNSDELIYIETAGEDENRIGAKAHQEITLNKEGVGTFTDLQGKEYSVKFLVEMPITFFGEIFD